MPSDWPTLEEYYILQPRPAAELGPPQASEAKISSSGPLVATSELQLSFALLETVLQSNTLEDIITVTHDDNLTDQR